MYIAVFARGLSAVQLLLKLGADTSIKEARGRTIFEYARDVLEGIAINHEEELDQRRGPMAPRTNFREHVQLTYWTPTQYADNRVRSREILKLLEAHAKGEAAIETSLVEEETMRVESLPYRETISA